MNEMDYSAFLEELEENQQVDDDSELRSLFALSSSIKELMVPVNAAPFKISLRERLERRSLAKPRFAFLRERQNVILMAVAAAGSLLSITGVVLLVLRRLKTAGEGEQPAAAAPI